MGRPHRTRSWAAWSWKIVGPPPARMDSWADEEFSPKPVHGRERRSEDVNQEEKLSSEVKKELLQGSCIALAPREPFMDRRWLDRRRRTPPPEQDNSPTTTTLNGSKRSRAVRCGGETMAIVLTSLISAREKTSRRAEPDLPISMIDTADHVQQHPGCPFRCLRVAKRGYDRSQFRLHLGTQSFIL